MVIRTNRSFFSGVAGLLLSALLLWKGASSAVAADGPHIEHKDGRYALFVDDKPYLVLAGQIHNSSAWPSELPPGLGVDGCPAREHRRGSGLLGAV